MSLIDTRSSFALIQSLISFLKSPDDLFLNYCFTLFVYRIILINFSKLKKKIIRIFFFKGCTLFSGQWTLHFSWLVAPFFLECKGIVKLIYSHSCCIYVHVIDVLIFNKRKKIMISHCEISS